MLEGQGEPDLPAWRRAMDAAVVANPGARVVLRGMACGMRWEPTGAWRVREVDGSDWEGMGPEGAPFLRDPLDLVDGPTTEVLIVKGTPSRIVVRTSHATMDGGGTWAFLTDLFRARNGESPLGNPDVRIDLDFTPGGARSGPPAADALPPMGPPEGTSEGMTWRRVQLSKPRSPLLGRVAVALARSAREHGEGLVRFDIPVDLRRAHPDVRSTGNLTGMVAVEVGESDTPEDAAARIREAVASGRHLERVRGASFLRHLPQWLVDRGAAQGAERHRKLERFAATAILSNLGRLDTTPLQTPDFQVERVFFVPPGTQVTPLFIGLSGTAAGTEIVASSPERFASDGRLDQLLQVLAIS